MKLWIDDLRPAPDGYVWLKSTREVLYFLKSYIVFYNSTRALIRENETFPKIEVIDIDHDSGQYYKEGGDYIEVLNWLEEYHLNYPIHIHSMNPVGVENMRAIIQKNGWKEV